MDYHYIVLVDDPYNNYKVGDCFEGSRGSALVKFEGFDIFETHAEARIVAKTIKSYCGNSDAKVYIVNEETDIITDILVR